jgi:hypothetical protein
MKAEKIILSFVAVFVGLICAGVAFYFYQSTKVIPAEQAKPVAIKTEETPTPQTQAAEDTNILTVDEPKDEAVSATRSITIKGKTAKGTTVIVSTTDLDQIVQPAANGDYTLTQTIPDGTSLLEISATFPDGTQKKITKTVTFSTENF